MTWAKRRAPLALVALVGLGLVLGACGVPTNTSAHILPDVEFNPPTSSTTSTTIAPSSNSEHNYSVFFLLLGVLTPVTRPDPSTNTPVTTAIAIASLDNGPNVQEIAEGYESALTQAPGAQVSYVGITKGVVTVAINSNFVNLLLGQTLPEAYGQVVMTLDSSSFPQVQGVRFEYDGTPLDALLPNGDIKSIVDRCDYESIATKAIKAACKSS